MTINEALRNRRYDTGITQNELHRRSGVPQRNISFWESGRGCPTVDDAIRLAAGFGVSLAELLRDVDETSRKEKSP